MKTTIHLCVPYRERHRVKALGAHWDPVRVCWYITQDRDLAPFQRWMKSPRTTRIRIGPAYLLSRKGLCSRCHDHSKVYGLGTSQLTCSPGQEKHVGFFTLFHIICLPKDFYCELQQQCLTFLCAVRKTGAHYWKIIVFVVNR